MTLSLLTHIHNRSSQFPSRYQSIADPLNQLWFYKFCEKPIDHNFCWVPNVHVYFEISLQKTERFCFSKRKNLFFQLFQREQKFMSKKRKNERKNWLLNLQRKADNHWSSMTKLIRIHSKWLVISHAYDLSIMIVAQMCLVYIIFHSVEIFLSLVLAFSLFSSFIPVAMRSLFKCASAEV